MDFYGAISLLEINDDIFCYIFVLFIYLSTRIVVLRSMARVRPRF